jgi:dihydrolipoyl dehydrogenase
MSDPTDTFDIVVLGGGSAGYACALRAGQLGLSIALVEQDRLGGTCLHNGCVPTKALLHAAEVADSTREGHLYGVLSSFGGVDMVQVNAYKDGVVSRLYKGLQGLVKAGGVTYIEGAGHVTSPTTVDVDGRRLTGRHLVLATGSYPRMLPGVEPTERIVTSEQALQLREVPGRVVIIGGSVIGVEFASVWRSFGAEVTVVEALPNLVPLEDAAMSKVLERAFRKRGIQLRLGATVDVVKETESGVSVGLADGVEIEADLVLVAIGRGPASSGAGFEDAGVTLDRGWVVTDERLRTTAAGVYAVGDLVPGLQLAHRGFAHGIFVAEDIAGLEPAPVEDRVVPRITYCDPEIASVGLTETQARELYGDVETREYSLAGNGKSQILGTNGLVKLVRETDGPIVGVHMVGARMGEQVGEAALMVSWEAFPEDIARFVHAHPTQNEALGEAALALAGKPLHDHA